MRLLDSIFLAVAVATYSSANQVYPAVMEYMVRRGEDVSLRCPVDKQDPNVVVYWNRGSSCTAPFISIGRKVLIDRYEVVVEESGASLSDFYTLKLGSATETDEGNYTCAAQSGKTGQLFAQTFYIQLIESPILRLDRQLESGSVYKIRIHNEAQIGCRATGKPEPDVRWSRLRGELGRQSESIGEESAASSFVVLQTERNASVLQLRRANASLNGSKFECLASNVAGAARHRIEVFVEIPPKLRGTNENVIHTAIGNIESLKCSFEANPPPEIQWQIWSDREQAFVPISARSRKYNAGKKEKALLVQEFSLCIFNMQLEDVTRYRCVATSNMLQDSIIKTFNVTLAPSEPVVRVDDAFVFADACNISWYTISTNTTHYYLEIRPYNVSGRAFSWSPIELKHESQRLSQLEEHTKSKTNLNMKSVSRQQHSVKNYTGTHIISRLSPNTSYEVRIRACNLQHCSGFSNIVAFLTPDESRVAPSWFTSFKLRAQAEANVLAMKKNGASSEKRTQSLLFASLCFTSAFVRMSVSYGRAW